MISEVRQFFCHPPALGGPMAHRGWLFTICSFAGLFTTMLTVAYNSLQLMMYHDGHLAWTCVEAGQDPDTFGGCEAQQIAFSVLFSVISVADLGTTFVAGQVFDRCGPAFTALIGQFSFHIGWICFLNGSEAQEWLYTMGIVFMGAATNFNAMPIYTLGDHFPKQRTFLIHYTGVTETASALILPIMRLILHSLENHGVEVSFKTLMTYYMVFLSAPVGVLYILSLPRKRQNIFEEADKLDAERDLESQRDLEAQRGSSSEDLSAYSSDDVIEEHRSVEEPNPSAAITEPDGKSSGIMARIRRLPSTEMYSVYCSVPFIGFTIYYTLHAVTWNYYDANSMRILGAEIAANGEIVRVLLSVCLSLGWGVIASWVNVLWTNLVIIIMAGIAYILPLVYGFNGPSAAMIASYVTFFVGYPQFWASKHVFCANALPSKYFGRTAGWITLGAGIVNIPMVAVNEDGRLGLWMPLIVISQGVCFLVVGFMLWHNRYSKKGGWYQEGNRSASK